MVQKGAVFVPTRCTGFAGKLPSRFAMNHGACAVIEGPNDPSWVSNVDLGANHNGYSDLPRPGFSRATQPIGVFGIRPGACHGLWRVSCGGLTRGGDSLVFEKPGNPPGSVPRGIA